MWRITFYILFLFTVISCGKKEQIQPVRKTIQEAVFASGKITQDDEYIVSANADGIILEIPVKEGDTVVVGTFLARIKSDVQSAQVKESSLVYQDALKNSGNSSPQLLQIQAEINQAQSQLALDKLNYERYAGLRKTNSVSPLELENAELKYKASQNSLKALQQKYDEAQNALQLNAGRSRTQLQAQQDLLDNYTLTADKPGRIINVYKKKGELVRKGEVIARIGSGPYILKLYVAEEDIVQLRLGQEAAISLNTYPDSSFTAKITKILPAFDETEQSYVVQATFTVPANVILSGTQLQANIVTGTRKSVLLVPVDALIRDNTVLLKNGDEKKIKTGKKYGRLIEVKSGLTENDVLQVANQEEKKESGDMMQTN
ncbi:hypothetical protein HYN59_15130 [Flavobacterium album]|uniref:CusB-like beta-barrel domain-containing protein n=1 Tax=Flavobacterium album TaxID=2175091 RepID=A0A2S1R198_9FLAO|nr:hypothetical protein HYN59_15130 [Flavobacterium album]